MKLDVASLIACGVLTGFGAVVNTAEVGAGASVVVIGCGGVGLNSVQGARVAGAAPIIAVDVADGKLEAAARSARRTRSTPRPRTSPRGSPRSLTGGRRISCSSPSASRGAAEQAISLMARNGATVLVGMPPSGVRANFDPGWLAADGQRILGSKMGSARLPVDVPKLVELYRKAD